MRLQTLILVVFLTGCLCDDFDNGVKNKVSCDELNTHFLGSVKDFQECVLKNNKEATFCLNCAPLYGIVLFTYNHLMTANEPNNQNISCRSQFVDINQLNIVEDTFASMKRFWDEGVCSDCFVAGCNFANNNDSIDCDYSNRTEKFWATHNETIDCIDVNKKIDKTVACDKCAELYRNLTKQYDAIRLKTENHFCFAIKFWMNKTQSIWTDEIQCCSKRQEPTSDFYVLSAFSIVIGIGFYIATFIIGKRNERVQFIPDDLMPPAQNRLDDTVTNIDDTESIASTNLLNLNNSPDGIQSKPTNYGSLLNSSSSDDNADDDEDILPVVNPNLIQI